MKLVLGLYAWRLLNAFVALVLTINLCAKKNKLPGQVNYGLMNIRRGRRRRSKSNYIIKHQQIAV